MKRDLQKRPTLETYKNDLLKIKTEILYLRWLPLRVQRWATSSTMHPAAFGNRKRRRKRKSKVKSGICFWRTKLSQYWAISSAGWRRLMGCLKLQVIFRKRATNYTTRHPATHHATHLTRLGAVLRNGPHVENVVMVQVVGRHNPNV